MRRTLGRGQLFLLCPESPQLLHKAPPGTASFVIRGPSAPTHPMSVPCQASFPDPQSLGTHIRESWDAISPAPQPTQQPGPEGGAYSRHDIAVGIT